MLIDTSTMTDRCMIPAKTKITIKRWPRVKQQNKRLVRITPQKQSSGKNSHYSSKNDSVLSSRMACKAQVRNILQIKYFVHIQKLAGPLQKKGAQEQKQMVPQ